METHYTTRPVESRASDAPAARAARPGSGARVWAGAIILAGGLGLIVLGGCFLYGVLELVRDAGVDAGAPSASTLVVILYAMAFACFVAAAVLIGIGLWGLAKVLLERPSQPD